MQVERYFPTMILKEEDVALAHFLSPVVDKYLSSGVSELHGIKGHRSSYHNGELNKALNEEPEILEFKKIVVSCGKEFLKYRGYNADLINFNPFVFVSQIHQGAFFHRHAHPNSVLSGVFYVESYPQNAGLIIHDPRPYKMFTELPVSEPMYENATEISFDVNTGLMFMWDSWMEHEVPQNQSELPRKTLVFNL
jgi:uncharacterized protein (TIGR02466 family)